MILEKYKFSICIPTYDRAAKLNELLINIRNNISDKNNFQIVISDNASPFETARVVDSHQADLNIKYIRNDRYIGMSRNIIASVDYADGEYCILTGDDDIFRDGWFNVLEALVQTHRPDFIISNRLVCDADMNIKFKEECGPIVGSPTSFRIESRTDLINYLNSTDSTSGFGYLSNLVVRRKSWTSSKASNFVNDHAFPHMIKIIDYLYTEGGVILRVPFETVLARSGTDRLEEFTGSKMMSEFDKIMIHFDGFLSAAKYVAPTDRQMSRAIINPIIKIFSIEYQNYYLKFAISVDQEERGRYFLNQLLNLATRL